MGYIIIVQIADNDYTADWYLKNDELELSS